LTQMYNTNKHDNKIIKNACVRYKKSVWIYHVFVKGEARSRVCPDAPGVRVLWVVGCGVVVS